MDNKTILTEAIADVSKYINDLSSSTDPEENAKAEKFAYWLREYIRFLRFEKQFDPKKNKRYKRGDIVKVNLGFNVGSEEGGLHYAVVLDNINPISSSLLTIIPLTSVKPTKDITKLRDYEVYCGNAIYEALYSKTIAAIKVSLSKIEELKTRKIRRRRFEREFAKLNNEMDNLNKMTKEIEKMKKGSIALITQITTISKIRICDPRHDSDVLANIRMPSQYLDIIDQKLHTFYLKEQKISSDLLTKV